MKITSPPSKTSRDIRLTCVLKMAEEYDRGTFRLAVQPYLKEWDKNHPVLSETVRAKLKDKSWKTATITTRQTTKNGRTNKKFEIQFK